MTAADILKPSPEIQRQLDRPNNPLASYARALKSLLEQERQQSWQLVAAKRQLEAEVRNFKASAEADAGLEFVSIFGHDGVARPSK